MTAWERVYQKQYYKKHKKEILARRKQAYLENREKILASNKRWNKNNKPKVLEAVRKCQEKAAVRMLKKRILERKYRARRKELNQKRYWDNRDTILAKEREKYAEKKKCGV